MILKNIDMIHTPRDRQFIPEAISEGNVLKVTLRSGSYQGETIDLSTQEVPLTPGPNYVTVFGWWVRHKLTGAFDLFVDEVEQVATDRSFDFSTSDYEVLAPAFDLWFPPNATDWDAVEVKIFRMNAPAQE